MEIVGPTTAPRLADELGLEGETWISRWPRSALVDLFALDKASVFDPLMANLGYDPNNLSINTNTPAGIGNVACAAVLAFRHADGSNQLGDLHPGAYSDWTGYVSVNPASTVPVNPRWCWIPTIAAIDLRRRRKCARAAHRHQSFVEHSGIA